MDELKKAERRLLTKWQLPSVKLQGIKSLRQVERRLLTRWQRGGNKPHFIRLEGSNRDHYVRRDTDVRQEPNT